MLSGPALADLARRTRGLAMRFDQVRRDTVDFGVPADCPNTARRLAEIRRAEREGRPVFTGRRPGLYART